MRVEAAELVGTRLELLKMAERLVPTSTAKKDDAIVELAKKLEAYVLEDQK